MPSRECSSCPITIVWSTLTVYCAGRRVTFDMYRQTTAGVYQQQTSLMGGSDSSPVCIGCLWKTGHTELCPLGLVEGQEWSPLVATSPNRPTQKRCVLVRCLDLTTHSYPESPFHIKHLTEVKPGQVEESCLSFRDKLPRPHMNRAQCQNVSEISTKQLKKPATDLSSPGSL